MEYVAAVATSYVPESAGCRPGLRCGRLYARRGCRMADGFARGWAAACGADTNRLSISIFSAGAACGSFGRHLRSAETDTDDGSMDVFCGGGARCSDGAASDYALGSALSDTYFVDWRCARSADLASGPSRSGAARRIDVGHCSKRH